MGRSSPDIQGQDHANGPVSQSSGHGHSQDRLGQVQEDGAAEDLVSDVHQRAQSASQAAVAAGQEQQQKVHALPTCFSLSHSYIVLCSPLPHSPLPLSAGFPCPFVSVGPQ